MKLYTKTGDDGTTGLYGGGRISKTSARIHAIGEVDELNATIGIARTYAVGHALDDILGKIQDWLFDVGAELASPPGGKFMVAKIQVGHIQVLEDSMDHQNEVLPELKAFILPGGSPMAAHLHLARSVCRRAERAILDLHLIEPIRSDLLVFMNRLSDWFFASARTANYSQNVNDIAWRQSEAL